MNLSGIPVRQKAPKAVPDPDYLARVAECPCCICEAFGLPQLSPTTVHHVIMGRHSQRKTPDIMAVPLCDGHHQGRFDNSKVALHREPTKWRRLYGPDVDWTLTTQDKLGVK